MKEIWIYPGDISIPELIGNLNSKHNKGYARTTVTTFLIKLQAKGYVRTYRKGKLSFAHATISEAKYRLVLLAELKEFWYDGSVENIRKDLDAITVE